MKGNMLANVSRSFNKVGFKIKKHSPEILIVAGITGVVASTVLACKATLKVNDILEETKEQIDTVHNYVETEGYSEKYTEDDQKKDLAIIYTQTGVKLAKLYAPAIGIGVISIASIVMSHRILTKRNVALAAAYATIDKSFKSYRSRVVERFGDRIDYELRHNIKAKEIETTEKDENGNEITTKKVEYVVNPSDISEYARFFEEYTKDEKGNVVKNDHWNNDNEHNLVFLKKTEKYCNDYLRIKGILFLNEVYDMLGLPKTKAGQIVGWVYDKDSEDSDNYVDFGLYKDNLSYSDFVNGYDNAILLDFNVDGNVWEKM